MSLHLRRAALLGLLASFAGTSGVFAQTPNQNIPYSYQFYQKLNPEVYNPENRFHSSIRGYFSDDTVLVSRYRQLMGLGVDSTVKRSWLRRKLTDEHLINARGDDWVFYADYLPDEQIGRELQDKTNTWLNTRGFQTGGSVGKQFSFYVNAFENQAVFSNYINKFIDSNQVVPSELRGRLENRVKDWSYVTALISYTPNKHLNLALGYDKNFIGDGYRSMLLSDNAGNYSFLRLRASLGNVQYQTIFAYMLDPGAEPLTVDRDLGDRAKWAAMHYLDWNITKRFSFGFFQAVTWADAYPEGKRGFDFNYVHPFIFLRPLEGANTSSPDKMRIGFNTHYEILDKTTLYGQFMFDEFTAKEFFAGTGYWANKSAIQLGVRGSDLLKVNKLNYLLEFNTARPYTYAHYNRVSNYAQMNQPLAHPLGANFREFVGLMNYSYRRFDFQAQLLYAFYGTDPEGLNYGMDLNKDYRTHVNKYGNFVGQGIATDLYFGELKVAYLINPKYNLRVELGGVFRNETSSVINMKTNLFTIGLRSSFRNLYRDF